MSHIYSKKNNSTILIIEDDIAFQNSLKLLLEREGYQIVCVNNGEEGIKRLAENSIHLVISDFYLGTFGKIHGIELIDQLKKIKQIPIVILTAFGDCPEYRENALEKGVFDFLTKPIKKEKLLSIIHCAMEPKKE